MGLVLCLGLWIGLGLELGLCLVSFKSTPNQEMLNTVLMKVPPVPKDSRVLERRDNYFVSTFNDNKHGGYGVPFDLTLSNPIFSRNLFNQCQHGIVTMETVFHTLFWHEMLPWVFLLIIFFASLFLLLFFDNVYVYFFRTPKIGLLWQVCLTICSLLG